MLISVFPVITNYYFHVLLPLLPYTAEYFRHFTVLIPLLLQLKAYNELKPVIYMVHIGKFQHKADTFLLPCFRLHSTTTSTLLAC